MDNKNIQNIAIYLRKSRDDEARGDDVLENHRNELVEYANKQGWQYKIYTEIKSGQYLSERTEMKKLLEDIDKGLYHGVLVKDFDRLSRGAMKDRGIIIEIFMDNNCLIITPDRIYNLHDDSDNTIIEIKGIFANTELRIIKKRLVDGKKSGAKKGNWTNGKPPYPYYYKREIITDVNSRVRMIGQVEVDNERKKVYEQIKSMYLSGKFGAEKIAIKLNQAGYSSPGGKIWSPTAVQRLLVHEFHLGKSIYGKYEWKKDRNGRRRQVRKKEETEWSIGIGKWEMLKTEEEHQKILEIQNKNTKVPHRSKQGIFPTTGLLYCKKCGYRMKYSVGRLEKKTGKKYDYTKCLHPNYTGITCSQQGTKMNEDFFEAIFSSIITSYLNADIVTKAQINQEEFELMKQQIQGLEHEIEKYNNSLRRIKDAFNVGIYDMKEFGEEHKECKNKIETAKKAVMKLEGEIEKATSYSHEELTYKIEKFKDEWQTAATPKEQNDLLKSIVKKIWYDREDYVITFEIEYL